jgi:dTDP-glucose 4,6-dehydratase
MSRILVTGGHDVLNVDALTYAGLPANVAEVADAPNYAFLEADIRDGGEMATAIAGFMPDAIIHLAAESHVDRSIDDPMDFLSTNVLGTASLLRAAETWLAGRDAAERDAFRLLHISTDEVYGALGADGVFTEDSPIAPNSPYAASKASSDLLARAWLRTWNLPVIVCRSSNNYGPRQFPEKLIPRTIISALHGRDIEVYAQGENVRDWVYVDDNVDALVTVLERGEIGGVYNIGADTARRCSPELGRNIGRDRVARGQEIGEFENVSFIRRRRAAGKPLGEDRPRTRVYEPDRRAAFEQRPRRGDPGRPGTDHDDGRFRRHRHRNGLPAKRSSRSAVMPAAARSLSAAPRRRLDSSDRCAGCRSRSSGSRRTRSRQRRANPQASRPRGRPSGASPSARSAFR